MKIKFSFAGIIIVLGLFLLSLGSTAFAEDSAATTENPTPSLKLRQEIRQIVKDGRPEKTPKPTEARQKVCELHIKVIKAREERFGQNGGEKLKRLDAISLAVQKYYTEKLLSQGKTVSNYDALVSDANAKKVALTSLVDKVKADSSALTCTNDRAKGQFQTFRTDAQALLAGLRSYRLSVISLVKAVKAVSGEAKLSPRPSTFPTGTVNPAQGTQ